VISLSGKSNFFERRVPDYKKAHHSNAWDTGAEGGSGGERYMRESFRTDVPF
jgi:hypothetical protein